MAIFTLVDEGYDVRVCRSQKAAAEDAADSEAFVVPEDPFDEQAVWVPATKTAIKRALRNHDEVRISALEGERDWVLKITKHD